MVSKKQLLEDYKVLQNALTEINKIVCDLKPGEVPDTGRGSLWYSVGFIQSATATALEKTHEI